MKKVFKIIFIVALLILLLAIIASAHSGRTDSNGGHYDHSNGSYHYHHGRPAHSHYDIDGDGYVDCPYNHEKDSSQEETVPKSHKNNALLGIIAFGCLSVLSYRMIEKSKRNSTVWAVVFYISLILVSICFLMFFEKL